MVERFGVNGLAFLQSSDPLGSVIHIDEAANGPGLSGSSMFPDEVIDKVL
jgi:hypothetical protein